MSSNLSVFKHYLSLMTDFAAEQEFEPVFHKDIQSTLFPDKLNSFKQVRNYDELLPATQLGKQILNWQKFDITKEMECGDTVLVECEWSGEIKLDAEPFRKGQLLKVYLCNVADFKDGKIHRLRIYSCYDRL